MFVSVDGKAKEVTEIFAGGADGLAHKINEVFGSVNGVAKLIFSCAPREKNKFDELTWAEIKSLADQGRLLDFFKKGDKVNIKFKEPLSGTFNIFGHDCEWFQDAMTLQITELNENGMKLVSYTALPLFHGVTFGGANSKWLRYDLENVSTNWGRVLDYRLWGLSTKAYNSCHMIDEKIPDDLRDVLRDFEPCITWEHYEDHEKKVRLRKVYDDCRVRQLTTNCYAYHKEFVEENDRYEYILDYSAYPKSESVFKKYMPEEIRSYWGHSQVRGYLGVKFSKEHSLASSSWRYKELWQDADISWNWDWENYANWNQLDMIDNPVYYGSGAKDGLFIPEMIIGKVSENKELVGDFMPYAHLYDIEYGPK